MRRSGRIGARALAAIGIAVVGWELQDRAVEAGGVEPYAALGHASSITSVAIAPDGSEVASADERGVIKIWDADTGALQRTIRGHDDGVEDIGYSPSGRALASGSRDATIKIWDTERGELLRALTGHARSVNELDYAADGALVSGSADRTVRIWDPETGSQRHLLSVDQAVRDVDYDPSGEQVAAAVDGEVVIWSADGEPLQTLGELPGSPRAVALGPGGRQLAIVAREGAYVLSARSGRAELALDAHYPEALTVGYVAGLGWLTVGGPQIRIWGVKRGNLLHTIHHTDHTDLSGGREVDYTEGAGRLVSSHRTDLSVWTAVTSARGRSAEEWRQTAQARGREQVGPLVWSADGRSLHTFYSGRGILTWNVSDKTLQHTDPLYRSASWIEPSPDGRSVAVVDAGSVRIWDVERRQPAGQSGSGADRLDAVVWSHSGQRIALGGGGRVLIWDLATDATTEIEITVVSRIGWSADDSRLIVHNAGVETSAWRTDTWEREWAGDIDWFSHAPVGGPLATTGSSTSTISLRDARTWDITGSLGGLEGVHAGAWSPGGRYLAASSSMTDAVGVWEVETGELLYTLEGHEGTVEHLAFSPDGRTLATGSRDSAIKLWEVEIGGLLHTLKGHEGTIEHLAFSPDGRALATGSRDSTIKIWDTATGALSATLIAGEDDWVAFAPDGRYVSESADTALVRFRRGAETFSAAELPELRVASLSPPIAEVDRPDPDHPPPAIRFERLYTDELPEGIEIRGIEIEPLSAGRAPLLAGRYAASAFVASHAPLDLVQCEGEEPIRRERLDAAEIAEQGLVGYLEVLRVTCEVDLAEGETQVSLLAMDTSGQYTTETEQFTAGPPPVSEEPVEIPQRWLVAAATNEAVALGDNEPLSGAENDADRLVQIAREQWGLPDANIRALVGREAFTPANFELALRDVLQRASRGDVVVVYLSTHGLIHPDREGDVLFVTGETDVSVPASTSLPRATILGLLGGSDAKNKRIVLIVDACFAGRLASDEEVGALLTTRGEAYRDFAQRMKNVPETGVSFLLSARPSDVAIERLDPQSGYQGDFSRILFDGLEGAANQDARGEPDGQVITLDEVVKYVERELPLRYENAVRPHCLLAQGHEDLILCAAR